MDRRGCAQLVQPFQEIVGAIRKTGTELSGAQPSGRSYYRVQESTASGKYYLRISSKSTAMVVMVAAT
jgi:5-enolpyruvylshikimate-3-phosphate synthase